MDGIMDQLNSRRGLKQGQLDNIGTNKETEKEKGENSHIYQGKEHHLRMVHSQNIKLMLDWGIFLSTNKEDGRFQKKLDWEEVKPHEM